MAAIAAALAVEVNPMAIHLDRDTLNGCPSGSNSD